MRLGKGLLSAIWDGTLSTRREGGFETRAYGAGYEGQAGVGNPLPGRRRG